MKTLLTIFTLIFTVMFSSTSFGGWTKVSENVRGNAYVDFGRIRKHGGYVYWWELTDFIKPLTGGVLSGKRYKQGDCKLFRYKSLSWSFHKEPMGGGTGEVDNVPDKEWTYPPPKSVSETVLEKVCSR